MSLKIKIGLTFLGIGLLLLIFGAAIRLPYDKTIYDYSADVKNNKYVRFNAVSAELYSTDFSIENHRSKAGGTTYNFKAYVYKAYVLCEDNAGNKIVTDFLTKTSTIRMSIEDDPYIEYPEAMSFIDNINESQSGTEIIGRITKERKGIYKCVKTVNSIDNDISDRSISSLVPVIAFFVILGGIILYFPLFNVFDSFAMKSKEQFIESLEKLDDKIEAKREGYAANKSSNRNSAASKYPAGNTTVTPHYPAGNTTGTSNFPVNNTPVNRTTVISPSPTNIRPVTSHTPNNNSSSSAATAERDRKLERLHMLSEREKMLKEKKKASITASSDINERRNQLILKAEEYWSSENSIRSNRGQLALLEALIRCIPDLECTILQGHSGEKLLLDNANENISEITLKLIINEVNLILEEVDFVCDSNAIAIKNEADFIFALKALDFYSQYAPEYNNIMNAKKYLLDAYIENEEAPR